MSMGMLSDAVEALAQRAAAVRAGLPAEKQADMLTALGSAVRNNPALSHALIGGGLGAGAGAASTLIGNHDKDPDERKSPLRSLITGGLAGTAFGGGVGLARQGLAGLKAPGSGGDAMPSGDFVDPATGQRMRIDPEVLKSNPGLLQKIRQLRATPLTPGHAVRSTLGGAWNWLGENMPFSRTALPLMGLGDAAAHAPGLNLGERLGFGRIRPQFSQSEEHLRRGISELGDKIPGPISKAIHGDRPNFPDAGPLAPGQARVTGGEGTGSIAGLLARLTGRGNAADSALETVHQPSTEIKVEEPVGEGRRMVSRTEPGPAEAHALSRGQLQEAKRQGHYAVEKSLGQKAPRELRRIGPRQYAAPPTAARVGGRIAAYGALPITELLLRDYLSERGEQQDLRSLYQQHAKPVGGSK